MLPDRALILCDGQEEIRSLFEFLDQEGATWRRDSDARLREKPSEIDFEGYAQEHGQLCISLQGGQVGYCNEQWYREVRSYENTINPKWNYISVQAFIELCGGVYQEEECAIDMGDLL